jgi:hypothetical protein
MIKSLTWYVKFPESETSRWSKINYREVKRFDFDKPTTKQAFKSFLKKKYLYLKGLPSKTKIWPAQGDK